MPSSLSLPLYSKNVGALPRAKLVEATAVSKNERTASIAAVFEDPKSESHQPRWQAPIDLVLEPAGWRIDNMKGLTPASGHPLLDSAEGSVDETTQGAGHSAPQSATAQPRMSPSAPVRPAMFAVVQDPGGTTNVREEPFVSSKIVAVVKNGDRVEIDQTQGGWAHVVLSSNKSGFIPRSRLNITPEKQ